MPRVAVFVTVPDASAVPFMTSVTLAPFAKLPMVHVGAENDPAVTSVEVVVHAAPDKTSSTVSDDAPLGPSLVAVTVKLIPSPCVTDVTFAILDIEMSAAAPTVTLTAASSFAALESV